VEPTAHAFPLINVTRLDEVQPSLSPEDALRNAPAHCQWIVHRPKIVRVGLGSVITFFRQHRLEKKRTDRGRLPSLTRYATCRSL